MKFRRPGLTPAAEADLPAHHTHTHTHTKPLGPFPSIPQTSTYGSCLPFRHQAASFDLSFSLTAILSLSLLDSPVLVSPPITRCLFLLPSLLALPPTLPPLPSALGPHSASEAQVPFKDFSRQCGPGAGSCGGEGLPRALKPVSGCTPCDFSLTLGNSTNPNPWVVSLFRVVPISSSPLLHVQHGVSSPPSTPSPVFFPSFSIRN